MVKVKICGITNLEDALLASELGADALGFNFSKKSPRYIDPSQAKAVLEKLPPLIQAIGVFVDEFSPERVVKIAQGVGINTVQLHGNETPAYTRKISELRVIKAFRVADSFSVEVLAEYPADTYLLDTYVPGQPGGTGRTFNWDIAIAAKKAGKIILAGGLTPENIREAILTVQPFAVDICSGIEKSPGRKDPQKMKMLFRAITQSRVEIMQLFTRQGKES
jgi:phosphoribosylanthranilate isomerase